MQTLLWSRLQSVRRVRFVARGSNATGWTGVGEGVVVVSHAEEAVLTFEESGTWQPTLGRACRFTNTYRWTQRRSGTVRLEHLRRGPDQPVELFDLVAQPDGTWQPEIPHLCVADCYDASLTVELDCIRLTWWINGPKKSEQIEYEYW